jgi:peptidyl-prolyl cis-trans isomerase D
MMSFLRKNMRTIFAITMVGFFAGIFIGFGSYMFGGRRPDTAAEVDGTAISYRTYINQFNRAIDNMRQANQDVSEQALAQKKQEIMSDLIQQEIFWKEAKRYGITVSDGELAADVRRFPAFQNNGQFDQRAYFQVLYQVLHTTPKEFEDSRRKQISYFKLRQLIASSVKISEIELRMEYARANKGSMKNFEKDRAKFTETVRNEKTSMVFNEWFKQINQRLAGKVKVYLDEIEKKG